MRNLKKTLLLVFFVNFSPANMFSTDEEIFISDPCNRRTRSCALALRYSQCAQVINRETECSIRSVCSKLEFKHVYDLACRGQELLESLSRSLDPACVKKLESSECDLGMNPMTIFDYGNISKRFHLCDKIQASPIAKCLAGNVDYNTPDCTQEQYGSIVNVVCAVGAGRAHTIRLDMCLLCVPVCTCLFIVATLSRLMHQLSVTEFEMLVVLH
ncbi:unnamed protein product [Candidula unifasciata]|uniref:Uncharacterized protein n=1 Tax=Candidula unifasciata TaxID=100452 RepID=A0A8S3YDG3_9EUPU|nr:unnamed protein product [Candidula unifasciata]